MTKKPTMPSITKKDVADMRALVEAYRKYSTVRDRLMKKFHFDEFHDLDEYALRLGSRPVVTDEDICFALGRLTYDD